MLQNFPEGAGTLVREVGQVKVTCKNTEVLVWTSGQVGRIHILIRVTQHQSRSTWERTRRRAGGMQPETCASIRLARYHAN